MTDAERIAAIRKHLEEIKCGDCNGRGNVFGAGGFGGERALCHSCLGSGMDYHAEEALKHLEKLGGQ